MADVIAGFHLNYLTCGVARFNRSLSQKLNLCVEYFENVSSDKSPILSIKIDEFDEYNLKILIFWCEVRKGHYDLILHGLNHSDAEKLVIKNANRIYACNSSDFVTIKKLRADNVVEAFCPGSLPPSRVKSKDQLSILSFGMAHKLNDSIYLSLRNKLEEQDINYKVYFSTAVHEGFDFEESFLSVEKKIYEIFGDASLFLGFLSDHALSNQLETVDIYATFFQSGYRQNNTSANAALACGKCLLTNVDEFSPPWLQHEKNFLDFNLLNFSRLLELDLKSIGKAGQIKCQEHLSWDKLVSIVSSH